MASKLPSTMRALAITRHSTPKDYLVATLPVPQIKRPDELLIRVRAASVNPIDVKLAGDLGKLMGKETFPYIIGFDLAGEVIQVGSGITNFKPGDEVYSRVPDDLRGTIAQYALSRGDDTALKPKSLNFAEAASVPLVGQTALVAFDWAEEALGGLKGKTVFIPAGLSGTGSVAIQLAKEVFGAEKVITTVSTAKVPMISEMMGKRGPDQIIDYTKEKVVPTIGKGTVDFMFDTVTQTISGVPLIKKGGMIVSISTVPNGSEFKKQHGKLPWYLVYAMNLLDWFFKTWTSWNGVKYRYVEGKGHGGRLLERLAGWVDEGKLKPVVGSRVKLEDIEGVKKGCQQIFDAKGGVGKFVIEIE